MNTLSFIWRLVAVLLLLLLVVMDAMVQLPLGVIGVVLALLYIIVRDGIRNRLTGRGLLSFKILAPYGAIVLSVSLCVAGHYITDMRAKDVITTVERFKADHGRYPDSIDELIPQYYPKHPWINVSPMFRDYWHYDYNKEAGVHKLFWMIHFATTRIYTFELSKIETMG